MSKTEKEVEDMSLEEKLNELRERLGELDAIPLGEVEAIAAAVERLRRVDRERAYDPREGADGSFHHESGSLYDIVRLVRESGETVYVFILVDRDGRKLLYVVKEEDMTEADWTAFQVFQMGRDSPALRRLIDTARKINASRAEGDAEAGGAPPPQDEEED